MNDAEALLWHRLNRLRRDHGLPPYRWGTDRMWRDGRRHCRDMAAAGEAGVLDHDDFPLPANWTFWGQNVGEGPHASIVHRALVESPGHLANMLDADFRRATVSALRIGGLVWVTQNFVAP
jgi:uncharacterized protein YkwD